MRVRPEGPQLLSEMLRKHLNVDCCVLMGANIAKVPPTSSDITGSGINALLE